MKEDAHNPFMVASWSEAAPDVLRDACALSQVLVSHRLADLAMFYRGMQEIHAAANRRGIAFPTLLTVAEKTALELLTQNPLQN